MSILLKDISVEGQATNVAIKGNQIRQISSDATDFTSKFDRVIDGNGYIALPALLNGHTHAAMTLFRGYGDDLPLQEWLEDKIWPLEEELTEEAVYWGTRLACLEMIKTGTCFFNDMYWEFDGAAQAVEDSGMRARLSSVFIDQFNEEMAQKQKRICEQLTDKVDSYPERVQFALGPHSIYTVSEESLRWIAEYSRENNLPVHIHLSETKHEVEECKERHGVRPVEYLDKINFLHENVIAAHVIWVTKNEIDTLAERGVSVVYNPLSNLKLTAGDDFKLNEFKDRDVPVCLGTDGAASNNNLNLFEEIKMSALIQKNRQNDATALPATDTLGLAIREASEIFGINSGVLEEGKLADFILVDESHHTLTPRHDTDSSLAYAISPDAIKMLICDGEILMDERSVKDEEKIRQRVSETAEKLIHG